MFKVVIPARHASTRLPGKPLLEIAGRPMLAHVHERALASGASDVVIATDDERIRDACAAFGARVCMTDPGHASGTTRIAEVVALDGDPDERVIVNVQGDEPLIPTANIRQVAGNLAARPDADVATLCTPIADDGALFDPSVVKVVADASGRALYFSRATIPWYRDEFAAHPGARPGNDTHHRHIGIYAYRAGYLKRYAGLAECELERAERLEQLRVLHHGGYIHVAIAAEPPGPGVDTPRDLERVRALLGAARKTGDHA